MKILITGANGMVGRNLVELFHPRSQLLTPSHKELDLLEYSHVELYFIKHRPDCVVHLAADVGGLYKNMNKNLDIFENNLIMNSNIVKICRKYEIKRFFTMLSTCVFPADTTYPLNPKLINHGEPHSSNEGYSYAKRMLERHVQYVRDTLHWNWKCFIPVNIYGKYDNFDIVDGHVIPALIHKAYIASTTQKPFVVNGDGSALRQFVYAGDVADILYNEIMGNSKLDHNTILCGTREFSIKYVVDMIAAFFKIEHVDFDDTFSSGQHRKTVIQTLDTDFQKSMGHTMEWFKDNHLKARGTNE